MQGVSSLYLAIGSAYCISCSLGFVYTPLHNFIPYLLVGLGKLHVKIQSCVKTFLPSSENHSQNVPLPTPNLHYGAIFQHTIPKTPQECFYTTLYNFTFILDRFNPNFCSGIDDMFVMVQAFRNVMDGPGSALPLDERFGLAMKYAGVTITVTSVTDFIAFAIGATTVSLEVCSFLKCTLGRQVF